MADQFSGKDKFALTTAILRLFGDSAALDAFVQEWVGKTLDPAGPSTRFELRVWKVLQLAEADGWHLDLLTMLSLAFQSDHEVQKLNASFFAQPNPVPSPDSPPGKERIVANAGIFQAGTFSYHIDSLKHKICRLEYKKATGELLPYGTGFLVGPDLVLTNYHNIFEDSGAQRDLAKIYFCFDRVIDRSGKPLNLDNKVQAIDAGPILSKGFFSEATERGKMLHEDWGSNELDYALIKIDLPMGQAKIHSTKPAAHPSERRGWINLPGNAIRVAGGDPVIVMQHALGDTLGFSTGNALNPSPYNVSQCRIRYESDTNPGSSGGACFNSEFELIALHHYGDPSPQPTYNQGIPVDKIRAQVLADGVALEEFVHAEPMAAGLEMLDTSDLHAAELPDFIRLAEKTLGRVLDLDPDSPPERVVKIILGRANKLGKFKNLQKAIQDSGKFVALADSIQNFLEDFEDPCEKILISPRDMFLNHGMLRDLVRNVDSDQSNSTILVREDPNALEPHELGGKRGHSHIRNYLNYLRSETELVGDVFEIDLLEIRSDASGNISAENVANLIDSAIGLADMRWKSGNGGNSEFKQAEFLNSFINHFRSREMIAFLVIDSFSKVSLSFDKTVEGLISNLIMRIGRSRINVRLLLLDHGDRPLKSDVEAWVDTYHLGKIARDEIIETFRRLILRQLSPDGVDDQEVETLANTYADTIGNGSKSSYWGGELDPMQVRTVVKSIISLKE